MADNRAATTPQSTVPTPAVEMSAAEKRALERRAEDLARFGKVPVQVDFPITAPPVGDRDGGGSALDRVQLPESVIPDTPVDIPPAKPRGRPRKPRAPLPPHQVRGNLGDVAPKALEASAAPVPAPEMPAAEAPVVDPAHEFPAPGPVVFEQVTEAPTPPDDLAGIMADPEGGHGAKVKPVTTACKITMKPPKDSFFRAHPTVCYDVNIYQDAASFGAPYVVDRAIVPAFPRPTKRVYLFLCITVAGEPFFWAVRQSDAKGRIDEYAAGDYECAMRARREWVTSYYVPGRASHKVDAAEDDYGEPKWPSETPTDLLRMALKGGRVQSLDHELVLRLKGRKV